ncbi:MAG: M1 family metallopeptidase [Saprospiraceae bacterium]
MNKIRLKFSLFQLSFSLLCLFKCIDLVGQCNPYFKVPLSNRSTNYNIEVKLNDLDKTVTGKQTVEFTNQSEVEINTLKFYMYLNAFKNSESSFLKGTSKIFGRSIVDKPLDEWGRIDIQKTHYTLDGYSGDLDKRMKYISPDDGNVHDQSVLQADLVQPLKPKAKIRLDIEWTAKMPKTIARSGYSKDFYLFCHWFPQLGVFEKNASGNWDWNCHQFFRSTEFYADFGVYDVSITTDKKFNISSSGCKISENENMDNTITRKFHLEDVIDFAWAIHSNSRIYSDHWNGVELEMMLPVDYSNQAERFMSILKFAFSYLDTHVGKFPFAKMSLVCPPFYALQSGLMEYPTLITTGSFYGIPKQIRTIESLVVHEFVHQYFMSMVASNEKEEPWLDEGLATYFEDRIVDDAFGKKKSLVDLVGFKLDNKELTRTEYVGMKNPREGIVAKPAWEFTESNYKGLIYSKTATMLHSLQNLLGENKIDKFIQSYFNEWKFKHPRGNDFMNELKSFLTNEVDSTKAEQLYNLVYQSLYQAKIFDYSVEQISNEAKPQRAGILDNYSIPNHDQDVKLYSSEVHVQRLGDWIFPVELLVRFEDGSTKLIHWSGEEGMKQFHFEEKTKVISAQIDPEDKVLLDLNINNNSLTLNKTVAYNNKFTAKFVFWIQSLFQTLSFLV